MEGDLNSGIRKINNFYHTHFLSSLNPPMPKMRSLSDQAAMHVLRHGSLLRPGRSAVDFLLGSPLPTCSACSKTGLTLCMVYRHATLCMGCVARYEASEAHEEPDMEALPMAPLVAHTPPLPPRPPSRHLWQMPPPSSVTFSPCSRSSPPVLGGSPPSDSCVVYVQGV